jgi:site-specific recombinase XerD
MVGVGLSLQAKRELLEQEAPQYRSASAAQKKEILNSFTRSTGYHRKYAMWLLNHPEEGQPAPARPRPRHYGAEVQEVLVLAWEKMNCICAKRLVPFLPTFLEALERHDHVHLSETCREQLLSMSATTAERLLRLQRRRGPRGLSTTRAGTLLKQLIPIRTFQQWDETQPGFVEGDVVAHCGSDIKGSYLYTLALTDIATGWTECVPLLDKSQEAALEALQQARQRFPFPLLGVDTDNGGEFINDLLLSYCEQEQLTFTRGRPCLKNDQCFIEQKNGNIVRQMAGHARFVGLRAYQQLQEVYRAWRLFVNCFQPSMKLRAKYYDGRKVRRVYDPAKTPLQRLLLSKVMPDAQEQALQQAFLALDPVRLFEQVKDLQQALFAYAIPVFAHAKKPSDRPVRRFGVEACLAGAHATNPLFVEPVTEQHEGSEQPPSLQLLLDWPRTRHDPFKGEWELIASLVLAHPERGSGELFRQLQRRFPGRYQPSQLRTLQRGVRKIRARLRAPGEGPWQQEVIQATLCDPVSPDRLEQPANEEAAPLHATIPPAAASLSEEPMREQQKLSLHTTKEECVPPQDMTVSEVVQQVSVPDVEPPQGRHPARTSGNLTRFRQRRSTVSIEQAVQEYLESQRKSKRRPKTLEWHQTALYLFRGYLLEECQRVSVDQITEMEVRGWITFLHERPTVRGTFRAAGIVQSYARSVRAFCQWLVRRRYLTRTPFARCLLPQVRPPLPHVLEPEEWERLLQACQPDERNVVSAEQGARNRALLWVFAETGIRPCEACRLRLSDVDREQGLLRVKGKDARWRWVPLGSEGLRHLLAYMDAFRLQSVKQEQRRRVGEEALFVSETGHPLRKNTIDLVLSRLRKRAGITRKGVNPSLLRDTFAVRYLQAGGDLFALRELLGQEESAVVRRALRMSER